MLLRIGRVLSTKGLDGDLKVIFFNCTFKVKEQEILFFEKDGNNIVGPYKVLFVSYYKYSKNKGSIYILKLCDIESITDAEFLTKSFILRDFDSLPKNIFVTSELEECKIFSSDDELIGEVVDVIKLGEWYSLLVVRKVGGGEIFIPFKKEIICEVDIEKRKIRLNDIPGILNQ